LTPWGRSVGVDKGGFVTSFRTYGVPASYKRHNSDDLAKLV
jgi:hypothetical protein